MYLILALANALLTVYAIRVSARQRPFALLFWICSAFFAGYPLLVDSVYCATGKLDFILSLYRDHADGLAPILDDVILSKTGTFVLLFNLILFASLEIMGGRQPQWRTSELEPQVATYSRSVAIVLALGGMLSLLYIVEFEFGGLSESLKQGAAFYGFASDGYDAKYRYLREIANTFVYAAPFATYFGIRRRIPLMAIAGAIPALTLAYITSQRPWLSCVAGVLILYVLGPGHVAASRRLAGARRLIASPLRLAVIGALAFGTLFSAYFVRYGRTETFVGGTADAASESLASSLLMRDASIFVLYWTMDAIPDRLAPIGGYATLHIPSTLLHLPIQFSPAEQVGYYLGRNRNGWTDATLHPTVYGFAYCDLGWGGLLWAGIMALILGGAEIIAAGKEHRVFALAPMLSLLVTVVVRGSPHYGITRAWYASLMMGLVFFLVTGAARVHAEMATAVE